LRTLMPLVILLTALPALAADPAGGPGWYQLHDDVFLSVPFEGGTLVIAGGTPGFLMGVAPGVLRLRFERGVASSRNAEITTDSGPAAVAALTVNVPQADVRALLRQPLSKAKPAPGSPSLSTPGGGSASGGGGVVAAGGTVFAVTRDTVLRFNDTQEQVVDRGAASLAAGSAATRRRRHSAGSVEWISGRLRQAYADHRPR
jgi:hypothetical protein